MKNFIIQILNHLSKKHSTKINARITRLQADTQTIKRSLDDLKNDFEFIKQKGFSIVVKRGDTDINARMDIIEANLATILKQIKTAQHE